MSGAAIAQPKDGGHPGSLASTHPRLYHYTGQHAFRSILMGNSLWSTYYEDLNDVTEFRHMRERLAKVMADRFQPETLAEANPGAMEAIREEGGMRRAARRTARIVADNLYKVTFEKAEKEREQNSFVTSFCAHPEGSYEVCPRLSNGQYLQRGPR